MTVTTLNVPMTFTVNVEQQSDGTIVVTCTPSTLNKSAAKNSAVKTLADCADGVAVQDLVTRHHKRFKASRSQEVTDTLVARGWEPIHGPKYNRFIYEGTKMKVTLYANALDLHTSRWRSFMMTVPGAKVDQNEVRFLTKGDNFETAMKAVEVIEAWANGMAPSA